MNRRNLLKIIPAGLLISTGLIGFGRLFAAQNKDEKPTVANSSIDEVKALEQNPKTVTPIALSNDDWNKVLTEAQYNILRREGTERPGSSPLNAEKRQGEFVCAGCNLALFKSETKYESNTGWPSFYDIIEGRIATSTDFKIGYPRTEYHCARCGGHQGHVFKDGPKPTGLRYCNNGLALKFSPA
jgi:peptide-methionine (R)-S-oxide reductase